MEETEKKGSSTGLIIIALVLIIGAGAAFAYTKFGSSSATPDNTTQQNTMTTKITTVVEQPTVAVAMAASYKNGEYSSPGSYTSPGGPEEIAVKLTLKDNVITDATVELKATRPKSVTYQKMFVAGYKTLVVGKNINEVKLDKVSGSSLTPKGFNDAVEKIKAQAKV